MILNKVLEQDRELVIRAIYCEDLEFLKRYHQSAGQGLDVAVKDTLQNISPEADFFRVETTEGALVGFFGLDGPVEENKYVLQGFHVRIQFRVTEYLAAFWELVRQTIDNEFYTSVSQNNVKAAVHLLKNGFTIVGSPEYEGKNYYIFKSS